jgi:hypothetical protein
VEELLEIAREAGRRSPIDPLYRSCDVVTVAQILEKLLTSGRIASPRLVPVAKDCQKLPQPTLIKRCQRQLAPLEPAAEIGQHAALCANRVRRVPLERKLRCKALDVGGQRPSARLSIWCGCRTVASERHRPSP